MKPYFDTIKDKQIPHVFKKGELEEYQDICSIIWGGSPLDLTWAQNTNIYKEALVKYKSNNNET